MAYTDAQNRAFAKISYFDLSDRYEYFSAGKEYGAKVPLSDLLYPSEKRELLKDYGITEKELKKWSLVGVHDTNSDNGFAVCVIDTGDGEAAVAFRGSEGGFGKTEQWFEDWVNGDFRLMNSTMTIQQAEVESMMGSKEFQMLMSNYNAVTPVGHSLGGNLAEYYTVASGEHGLYKQIDRCVSLDGPGFSTEFIAAHRDQIAQIAQDKKMTHYRWSFVGELLYDLPIGSSQYKHINVTGGSFFTRHSLKYSRVDDGAFSLTIGPGTGAATIGIATKALDLISDLRFIPSKNAMVIGSAVTIGSATLITVASGGLYIYSWVKELLDGTYAAHKVQESAVREASENPEFYIDTAAFERLANESKRVGIELKNIASFLRKVRDRPKMSVPIIKQIYAIYEKIDDLLNTGSYCAKMAEESKATLDAVTAYLQETAADIKQSEKDAISLIESWGQR